MNASVSPADQPPSRRWDLIGRGLMAFNAVLTFAVFVNGLFLIAAASSEQLMVEGWRTFGYLIFSAMWAMLAFRPRSVPAIWELVIFHKIVMTVFAIAILPAPDAGVAAATDAFLSLTTIFAYVACRGWWSWRLIGWGKPATAATG